MPTNFVVEFLIWMLIAASVIALLAARLRIPYTVVLVLGGLAIGSISINLPLFETLVTYKPNWLTPNVTLVIFLPPLLFEGSLKLQFRHLRENASPILLLATLGVMVATLVTGFAAHWVLGLPILVALVFGAITAATDPISVLSIFKEMAVPRRLSITVEGESLFNDGTAAVLYGILVAGVASRKLGIWTGIQEFFLQVLGGIRGALALALALSLDISFPNRQQILAMTFGVVAVSIIVQGLSRMSRLGAPESHNGRHCGVLRERQMARP
jgi:Na+:H+ antiporter